MSNQDKTKNYNHQRNDITRRSRKRKTGIKKSVIVITTILVIMLVSLCLFFALKNNSNSLVGTWRYDEYTQYVFNEDLSGSLNVDDVLYEYSYSTSGSTLTIDFTKDVVLDCNYTYSIDGNNLTLVGGENTDGGTYSLVRE